MRPRRGKADDRLPEILEAATAEFIECGYIGARMDDIAARLGLSKPILYRHFKSKHALLEAVLQQELGTPYDQLGELIRRHDGPLIPLLKSIIARVNPNPTGTAAALPLFRLIVSEGFRVPEFAGQFFHRNLRPINATVQEIFARAMASGKMRKADTDFAARELFAPYFHTAFIMTLLGRENFDFWEGREYLAHALEAFCRSYEIAE